MSNSHNTEWLEAARENFEQAVAEDNISLAKAICEDIRDAGFRNEALILQDSLK